MQTFCSVRDTIKKNRSETDQEKIFAKKTYLIKNGYPNIQRTLKSQRQKTTHLKKWTKDLNRHLPKGDVQMTNKPEKRRTTRHVSGEMQVPTRRCHHTPIRGPESERITPNAGETVGQRGLSFTAGENTKWYSHLRRQWQFQDYTKHTLTT